MTCFPSPDGARVGEGDLGIEESELVCVVSLVVQAARRTRRDLPRLLGLVDENRISTKLHQELQLAQGRRRLRQFEFHSEGILNPTDTPRIGRIAGRIDFKVKFRDHVGDYEAYFGVESKRVRPARSAMSRYYVAAGVGKFANGPYSTGHTTAMLVGYVIAPDAETVLRDIRRRLAAAHPRAAPLTNWAGRTYRDALIVEGMVPRTVGNPIRLLHAFVRMHP